MRRIIVAIAVAMLVTGCVTPMIPLPPPDSRFMSLTIADKSKGVATFNYKPDKPNPFNGAYFFIFNENTGNGVIKQADEDGTVSTGSFAVKEGQYLSIWVKRAVSDERSDIVNLVVDYSVPRNVKDRK